MPSANPDLTPIFGWPTPTPPDPPDVPGDMKALAVAIEQTFHVPPPVSAYNAADPTRVVVSADSSANAQQLGGVQVQVTNSGKGNLLVWTFLKVDAYEMTYPPGDHSTDGKALYIKIDRDGTATTAAWANGKLLGVEGTLTASRVDLIPAGGTVTFKAMGWRHLDNQNPRVGFIMLNSVPITRQLGALPAYPAGMTP